MANAVLAINAGSSSLKFGLFDADGTGVRLRGNLSGLQAAAPHLRVLDRDGAVLADERWATGGGASGIERLILWIERQLEGATLVAAGHRVVHGGGGFGAPMLVDAGVMAALEALTPLAPLHQPGSLIPIRQLAALRPDLPQVACFDTAFHRTIVPPAGRYALPRVFEAEGIRHYGFHGLSYESIAATLALRGENDRDSRIVVAHLGSGASLCALRGLRSVDTTMGFSTLDGLMMGTRPGTLDPGILLFLLQERGYDAARLEDLLYHQSGLLGVSGLSGDMAELLASPAEQAVEAIDLFTFQVARQVAALTATLGGLDALVFTGGIGEHAAPVRARIAARLGWLGITLDAESNISHARTISAEGSAVVVSVVATDEEGVIARHCAAVIGGTV